MINDNVELFNISELSPFEKENAFNMHRVPVIVRDNMTDLAKKTSIFHTSGVEIRFVRLENEEITVKLYLDNNFDFLSAQVYLYYGSIQSGWEWNRSINLHTGINEFKIPECNPETEKYLAEVTKSNNLPFSSKVVRLILPAQNVKYIGVSGNVRPPEASEIPKTRALFYGSSITHGSIAPLTENYSFLCAQELGIDVCNFGFAGTCYLEKEMVDFITSRNDISFFLTELLTNCWSLEFSELESRIKYLFESFISKQKNKKLFVIDGLLINEKFAPYRKMVKKYVDKYNDPSNPNIVYICGLDLIKNSAVLSSDGVHPSTIGHRKISENLSAIIKDNI